jgi:hypothetical protein
LDELSIPNFRIEEVLFCPEDGGSRLLQNVTNQPNFIASHLGRIWS